MMTLRKKLLAVNLLLLAGLLAVVTACLGGLLRQREHVRASLAEYGVLRWVESSEQHLTSGKVQLHAPTVDLAGAADEFHAALMDMRSYHAVLSGYDQVLPQEISAEQQRDARQRTKAASTKLGALMALFDPHDHSRLAAGAELPRVSALADDAAIEIAGLMRVCNSFVNRTELESERDVRLATLAVSVLAGVILLAAVLVSAWQYRRISIPLKRLRDTSRRLATGDFSSRCDLRGDREFVELGADFNRMADDLAGFYKQLEQRVADKSRELVRAERLASVGYLAAGVAHEINNPLNIMSGHAELSIKQLRRGTDEQTVSSTVQALGIIREEAFRCKEITGKLLSLVKGGTHGSREVVSLTRAASDVALMVRAIRNFQGRRIEVTIDPSELLEVPANGTEMKQVLLNLTVNALEAVRPGTGEIVIDGRRDGDWIELVVRDNGRGMDRQTLDRVFEPFYTEKRGVGEPGTGLGLSITHAIVTDHGGTLQVTSAGPGKGSQFTVRLPAAKPVDAAVKQRALICDV